MKERMWMEIKRPEHERWLEEKLAAYVQYVNSSASRLSPSTRATYMTQAAKFVRWVKSDG